MPEVNSSTPGQACYGSCGTKGVQDGSGSAVDDACRCGVRGAIRNGHLYSDEYACRLNIGPVDSGCPGKTDAPFISRTIKLQDSRTRCVTYIDVLNRSSRQRCPVAAF